MASAGALLTLIAAISGSIIAAGCSGHYADRTLHSVADAGRGRFWTAGSYGYAAYFDGRELIRADYPPRPGISRQPYKYGMPEAPAATVLLHGGIPHLVTRPGDVLRRRGDRWRRLAVKLPDDALPYIETALSTPDDRIALHLFDRLLVGRSDQLVAGTCEVVPLERAFEWIHYVGNELVGIAAPADSGQPHVALRWAHDRWQTLSELPDHDTFGTPQAIALLAGGTRVVIGGKGLLPLDNPEAGRLQSTADLLSALGVASDATDPHIHRVVQLEPERALLMWSGGIIDYGSHPPRHTPLPFARFVGAVPLPDGGLRLVQQKGGIVDVRQGRIELVREPWVPGDEHDRLLWDLFVQRLAP